MSAYRRRLVVMVKEPLPGRVKTRLGQGIGMVGAAWWFRHQVRKLLQEVEDPRWETVLAVSPDHAGVASRIWPRHFPRWPQGSGDLGDRMKTVFRDFPPGPVCVIGADIPDIRKHHIADAFDALGSADSVFGPSEDGGYWLIGMKRVAAIGLDLFKDVRWSTKHALADTERSLGHRRVAYVATLRDVDTVDDL